jgi:hypothetical protein
MTGGTLCQELWPSLVGLNYLLRVTVLHKISCELHVHGHVCGEDAALRG